MHERLCPQCAVPMQGLRREEIELERCAPCGGVWFDRGELEQLSVSRARPLRIQPLETRCGACQGPLMEVRLGTLRGASCVRCEGVFIDGASMAQLPEHNALSSLPSKRAQVRCRGCAAFIPVGQATSTPAGPSCASCAPTEPAPSSDAALSSTAEVALDAVEGVLALLVAAIDLA